MKVFLTGATGFIGGSIAAHLTAAGHEVTGLVRSQEKADALGMPSVIGTLEDRDVLSEAALQADAVVNAANASHRGVVEIFLEALAGSGKTLIQTSGSSIVGDMAGGEAGDAVYDEGSTITPLPGRTDRVVIDDMVRAAGNDGIRTAIVCPTLIYGEGSGLNKHSMQVPWLFTLAEKHGGVPRHIGSGGNIWSNVHITDLVELYRLVLEGAPTGSFYFAENGEASIRELCEAISRTLGQGGRTESMSLDEGIAEWGDGAANYTMGSNSRVRGRRARTELGWSPSGPSVLEEIERGCYART